MLILWSGGLDSSLVLYYALEWWHGPQSTNWKINDRYNCEYECSEKDKKPWTLTIESNQLDSKQQELQKISRNKLTKFFKSKKWDFEQKTINLNDTVYCGTFPQPLMWLTQAALCIKDEEPLMVGWIRGDDATSHLHELQKLWKILIKLNGKRSKLITPLRFDTKYDVLREIRNKKIENKCWYCESPTDKNRPCGKCIPCLNMIGAKAILDKTNQKNAFDDAVSESTNLLEGTT